MKAVQAFCVAGCVWLPAPSDTSASSVWSRGTSGFSQRSLFCSSPPTPLVSRATSATWRPPPSGTRSTDCAHRQGRRRGSLGSGGRRAPVSGSSFWLWRRTPHSVQLPLQTEMNCGGGFIPPYTPGRPATHRLATGTCPNSIPTPSQTSYKSDYVCVQMREHGT